MKSSLPFEKFVNEDKDAGLESGEVVSETAADIEPEANKVDDEQRF